MTELLIAVILVFGKIHGQVHSRVNPELVPIPAYNAEPSGFTEHYGFQGLPTTPRLYVNSNKLVDYVGSQIGGTDLGKSSTRGDYQPKEKRRPYISVRIPNNTKVPWYKANVLYTNKKDSTNEVNINGNVYSLSETSRPFGTETTLYTNGVQVQQNDYVTLHPSHLIGTNTNGVNEKYNSSTTRSVVTVNLADTSLITTQQDINDIPITVDLDERANFDAEMCPPKYVRLHGKCVPEM